MHEHDARASMPDAAEHGALADATHARTHGRTYEDGSSTSGNSPSVSRAGGQKEFLVYMVAWPSVNVMKVGYTSRDERYRSFARHRDGVLFSLWQFPTEKLARAYESTVLAMLHHITEPAFTSFQDAHKRFGRTSGYSEFFRIPALRHRWEVFASWFPEPFLGDVLWNWEDAEAVLERRAENEARNARAAFDLAIYKAKAVAAVPRPQEAS